IFAIWEGGLAIYGGIIAAVVTVFILCRIKKLPAGAFLDCAVFGLIIGQICGRWGTFFNREAFGAETELFTRMGLTTAKGTIYVHPTFLYESLWNLAGLVMLHLYVQKGKRKYDGEVFTLYVLWYGIGRCMIEGLRADSLYIGSTGIRVSQLLAGVSAVIAAGLLLYFRSKPHTLYVNKNVTTEE
ncbi:MAG: prolipoprotein diacylglyceryl transferase, partial [Oscillospiraceae bacterium]|nr:prolipoprotein diacylglyceryl transferase [Oscillospiraceae bacterium]